MEKYGRAGPHADDNTAHAHAHCILNTYDYVHTYAYTAWTGGVVFFFYILKSDIALCFVYLQERKPITQLYIQYFLLQIKLCYPFLFVCSTLYCYFSDVT